MILEQIVDRIDFWKSLQLSWRCLGIIACGVSAYLICSPVASIVKSPKPWHLVFYAALSALYSAISIQTEGHLKENFVDFHMQGIWSAISGLLAVFVLGRTVWG